MQEAVTHSRDISSVDSHVGLLPHRGVDLTYWHQPYIFIYSFIFKSCRGKVVKKALICRWFGRLLCKWLSLCRCHSFCIMLTIHQRMR